MSNLASTPKWADAPDSPGRWIAFCGDALVACRDAFLCDDRASIRTVDTFFSSPLAIDRWYGPIPPDPERQQVGE